MIVEGFKFKYYIANNILEGKFKDQFGNNNGYLSYITGMIILHYFYIQKYLGV